MISGLVLKYLNGECFVIRRGYETARPVSSSFCLTVPTPGQGQIDLSAAEAQGHWWIKVQDNGPGLPERAKNNLFTAFQGGTTKGGSGLGLAISAELIRGHGGRLSLEKSDAQGSIFSIELPKANN